MKRFIEWYVGKWKASKHETIICTFLFLSVCFVVGYVAGYEYKVYENKQLMEKMERTNREEIIRVVSVEYRGKHDRQLVPSTMIFVEVETGLEHSIDSNTRIIQNSNTNFVEGFTYNIKFRNGRIIEVY